MKLINRERVVSILVSFVLFAAVPVAFAWTAAPPKAPLDNVPAPINVGNKPQIKNGFLGLYGGAAGMAIAKNDLSYTLANGLSLGVKGKVGADFYCNADGTKCADIDQLMGKTVINNTTVEGGCKLEQKTSTINTQINAGRNDTTLTPTFKTLRPGTWTVSGSGQSVKCGGSNCGNHGIWIIVTSKGSTTATGRKVLMIKQGKSSLWKWDIPETTFTLSQEEKLVGAASQGNMTGSLTITGPELVCPTS